jgi:predicted MPP superfamily phosphohydrolase
MQTTHKLRFAIISVLLLLFYLLSIIFTGNLVFGTLVLAGMRPLIWAFIIVYVAALLFILWSFHNRRTNGRHLPHAVFCTVSYIFGFVICLCTFAWVDAIVLTILLMVLKSLGTLTPLLAAHILRITTAASALLSIVLFIYGLAHAGRIKTKHYSLHLSLHTADNDEMGGTDNRTAHASAFPLRIALISDIHLGAVVRPGHLRKIVAAINNAHPHLVCIAGDIFDSTICSPATQARAQAALRAIDAPLGTYACLGNHDSGRHFAAMLDFIANSNIHLLADEYAPVANRILLVGRKDILPNGEQGAPRAAQMPLPDNNHLPVIVLDHQPVTIKSYGSQVALVLSGHTHYGQIFPANIVERFGPYPIYGYVPAKDGAPQAIISSGAGTWGPPLRIGTDNEVVVIDVA